MQNAGNFDQLVPHAINNDEGQASDRDFARTGHSADPATVWHVFQTISRLIDCECRAPGLRISETIFSVIADMRKVVGRGLRSTDDH